MPRFFAGKPVNGMLTLSGGDARHALKVLRLKPGDDIIVCDGECMDYECTVERAGKDEMICRVREARPSASEPRQRITVFMALPKGDKMDFIVRKTVELGVSRICPFISRNCVSRPDDTEKKVERWRRIAAEAAGQCGRGRVPRVEDIINVNDAFAQAARDNTALFFYENETHMGIREALAQGIGQTVSIVIGSEGGFDPSEAQAAVEAGLTSVSLGPRVLRCETAPLAALTLVMFAGGNMDAFDASAHGSLCGGRCIKINNAE